jgi:hypothetical protein
MEVVGIEHENTILELKEKNQKLKRKHAAAEEDAADKAEEAKNLAVRLAVRPTSWPQLAVTVRAYHVVLPPRRLLNLLGKPPAVRTRRHYISSRRSASLAASCPVAWRRIDWALACNL